MPHFHQIHDYGVLRLVTASMDGTRFLISHEDDYDHKIVFTPATGSRISLPAFPDDIFPSQMAFSANGQRLVMCLSKGFSEPVEVVMWATQDEVTESLRVRLSRGGEYLALSREGDYFAVEHAERPKKNTIAVYDSHDGHQMKIINGQTEFGLLRDILYLNDQMLFIQDAYGNTMLIDVEKDQLISKCSTYLHVLLATSTTDGRLIARYTSDADQREPSIDDKQQIQVNRWADDETLWAYPVAQGEKVFACLFSPDNSYLLLRLSEETLLFDALTGEVISRMATPDIRGYARFLADGSLLMSTDSVRLYRIE